MNTSRLKKIAPWSVWAVLTLTIAGWLGYALQGGQQQVFLPGATSHGHHQIEMNCATCHTDPFKGGEVLQNACIQCHGTELRLANDSHPMSKFTDPRNAALTAILDARQCATCHREHQPEITHTMGVTVADDICFQCHQDIAKDRTSHAGMDFKSCATGGCHNFHDNRGLYEDFLVKHMHEPDMLTRTALPARNMAEALKSMAQWPSAPLKLSQQDAPAQVKVLAESGKDWESTAHAKAGVNCSACHQPDPDTGGPNGSSPARKSPVGQSVSGNSDPGKSTWRDKPDYQVCMNCHKDETEGFLDGKHGMRLKAGLSPMRPELAKIDMKRSAHGKEVNCISCHSAHRFDTRQAAVEACLSCHDDGHSRAYKQSPHFGLWHAEISGKADKNTGVSCATCHLPREIHQRDGLERVLVQHNQNANLRPNEKMLRSVCMNCHGLGFAIDALADRKLIDRNFAGRPSRHIESIDMAAKRVSGGAPAASAK